MNALQFEAVKISLKQDKTGFVLTLNIHPDEIPEELMRDFVGARYGVAMVRIQDNETATPYDNRVKKAVMLCKEKSFQHYLKTVHQFDVEGEDDAVEGLYSLCEIASRTELNGNAEAKARFDAVLSEYEKWKDNDPF
jgi:hypothetical protein